MTSFYKQWPLNVRFSNDKGEQDKRSLQSQALNNQILKLKKEKEREIAWLTEITIKYQSLTDWLTKLTDW